METGHSDGWTGKDVDSGVSSKRSHKGDSNGRNPLRQGPVTCEDSGPSLQGLLPCPREEDSGELRDIKKHVVSKKMLEKIMAWAFSSGYHDKGLAHMRIL